MYQYGQNCRETDHFAGFHPPSILTWPPFQNVSMIHGPVFGYAAELTPTYTDSCVSGHAGDKLLLVSDGPTKIAKADAAWSIAAFHLNKVLDVRYCRTLLTSFPETSCIVSH